MQIRQDSESKIDKSKQSIPILIQELSGINRVNEPITFGLPFPRGLIFDSAGLRLRDHLSQPVSLQAQPLLLWPDESLKWVLLDFQATIGAMASTEYQLQYGAKIDQTRGIFVCQQSDAIIVDTGVVVFYLSTKELLPFERVVIQGTEIINSSQIILQDDSGRQYKPQIAEMGIETQGALRTTIKASGQLISSNKRVLACFTCRLSFYAQSTLVRLDWTLHNPKAAKHPGGLWDLGDENSVYFKDLSILVSLQTDKLPIIEWTTQPDQPLNRTKTEELVIYQDSSGGVNWRSSNHVNRFGQVMNRFAGYQVWTDAEGSAVIEDGKRANPIVSLRDNEKRIEAAIRGFWQNFPKALEVRDNTLWISLFPGQYADVFELQGGEQKTYILFLSFETNHSQESRLNWVQTPLIPHSTPEWYARTKALAYLTPASQDKNIACLKLIDSAIKGGNSFFKRREIIDEYGWRNFGEIYSDHEAVNHKGKTPLVAHYNNQYDVIYSTIIQYLRSGELAWFELMDDLARHVRDIDIYHTTQDRAVYNNGLFWHTDHYTDAATSTHRAYSRQTLISRGLSSYGGGPCNEHNYAAGLAYHYLLTGEEASREAAIGLADWVINMDDGAKGRFRYIDCRPTGYASSTALREYHGPGRGCGNSISALIDGYMLTKAQKYIKKAEELIRRSIHPKDDIESLNLRNAELRWSYTVFLQALGKYLDYKLELGQTDYMYSYVRESLLHYAKWMAENEVRFVTILDQVEYPTETWPAQDIRKSNVFKLAAKYSEEPWRTKFLEQSNFFFNACINDLLTFETRTLTRPVAILMANGYMQAYFQEHPDEVTPVLETRYDFGQPQRFKPQACELYKIKEWLMAMAKAIKRG